MTYHADPSTSLLQGASTLLPVPICSPHDSLDALSCTFSIHASNREQARAQMLLSFTELVACREIETALLTMACVTAAEHGASGGGGGGGSGGSVLSAGPTLGGTAPAR